MKIGAGHHGILTIDLDALRRNYQFLNSKSAVGCEAGVVVKADAYGLGVGPVSLALFEAGARTFFVATLEEGVELRGILPSARIFILNGFLSREGAAYKHYDLVPVLNTLNEIGSYSKLAGGDSLPALVHIDTGMNRLGLTAEDIDLLRCNPDYLSGLDVLYVMSHFTSSEVLEHPSNAAQRRLFEDYSEVFGSCRKSLCNSGGVFLGMGYHYDLTRTGIALYGGHPSDGDDVNPMSQVVSLKAPILQVKTANMGQYCGYNETYRFHQKSLIANVSIGYADGVSRALSNDGSLFYRGYDLPIRGRVSMDLVICDLSNVPEGHCPKEGDMVEVIGTHQTIDDLAKSAGTISYEILTSLGHRYHRSYIG